MVGVSNTAISKAINTGRLVDSLVFDPVTQEVLGIDPETGVEEWERNNPRTVSKKVAKLNAKDIPLPQGISYADARAVRENYQARLAKLNYEEKLGRLVEAEQVKKQAFDLARTLRNSLLVVPDRISHELAAETDSNRVHLKLTQAIIEVLEQVSSDGTISRDAGPDVSAGE